MFPGPVEQQNAMAVASEQGYGNFVYMCLQIKYDG